MEYVYLITGIIVVLIGCYILLQVKAIRDRANALFLEAEKHITDDKLEYVASNLYNCFPSGIRVFLN